LNTNDLSSSYLPSIITEEPQWEIVTAVCGEANATCIGAVATYVNVLAEGTPPYCALAEIINEFADFEEYAIYSIAPPVFELFDKYTIPAEGNSDASATLIEPPGPVPEDNVDVKIVYGFNVLVS